MLAAWLACIPEFPEPPKEGDTDTDTDVDADTDADADTDTDADADSDPLAGASDEFDADDGRWISVATVDGSAERLAAFDVGATEAGRARLVPEPSAWFEGYRGGLRLQEITGDFVVVAAVEVRNADWAVVVPESTFSLAGLMARAPLDDDEDHLIIGVGRAEYAEWYLESKTTAAGESVVSGLPWDGGVAELGIARVGHQVTLLVRPAGGSWGPRAGDCRTDLPATLQVGMMAVTDFGAASAGGLTTYDATEDVAGQADLEARFDHVRFGTPASGAPDCQSNEALVAWIAPVLDALDLP